MAEAAGARVTAPVAYCTVAGAGRDARRLVAAIVAGAGAGACRSARPRARRRCRGRLPTAPCATLTGRVVVAALGRVTAAALARLGATADVVASAPLVETLAGDLARHSCDRPWKDPCELPTHRLRRLRRTEALRQQVRETRLSPDNLVAPLFVCGGEGQRREIPSMPGYFQLSVDMLVEECRELASLGVPAVILFGLPEHKDAAGSSAADPEGPVPRALTALRREVPSLGALGRRLLLRVPRTTATAAFSRTGRLARRRQRRDARDLASRRLAYARGGRRRDRAVGDDGRHGRGDPRAALDGAGFDRRCRSCRTRRSTRRRSTGRSATRPDSTPRVRRPPRYQMDPANGDEALREVALDLDEGADIVMVKPALAYLDILAAGEGRFGVPVAAYKVSGEYAMVKAAARRARSTRTRIVDGVARSASSARAPTSS